MGAHPQAGLVGTPPGVELVGCRAATVDLDPVEPVRGGTQPSLGDDGVGRQFESGAQLRAVAADIGRTDHTRLPLFRVQDSSLHIGVLRPRRDRSVLSQDAYPDGPPLARGQGREGPRDQDAVGRLHADHLPGGAGADPLLQFIAGLAPAGGRLGDDPGQSRAGLADAERDAVVLEGWLGRSGDHAVSLVGEGMSDAAHH